MLCGAWAAMLLALSYLSRCGQVSMFIAAQTRGIRWASHGGEAAQIKHHLLQSPF